jgi:chromate reductase, NAD(P)H dehydrogenase (quinone)
VLTEQEVKDVEVFDFRACDIPMVGRGHLDKNHLTPFQQQLHDTWAAADLVIFTLPEYNWSTSGEFINALHQLGDKGFVHLFNEKVFALVGVSSGRGGRQPCLEVTTMLNKLISFLHQYSVVSPKLFESHETGHNLDDEGHSTGNPIYEKGVKDFVNYSLKIARKWHGIPIEA